MNLPYRSAPWATAIFLATSYLGFGCATVHRPDVVDAGAADASAISPSIEAANVRTLKRKVAVLRFSNETKYGAGAFGGALGKPVEQQASDMLKARLVESGKVILIDADGISAEALDLQPLHADFAIIGSVSEFGRRTSSDTGVFSRSKKQVAYAAVNLRLIDARTGKVVYAEEGQGESEVEAGRVFGVGQDAGYDSSLNDKAISAAISKLVSNILENLTGTPWQTGILSIDGDQILVAGGDEQGLLVGDMLRVMKRGRIVKDPQYGNDIELPREEVGRIQIVSFFGSGLDGQGSICTLQDGSISGLDMADLVVEEIL